MPRIPSVPRLPGLPDPLRRVHVPRDLESVTAIGEEEDAGAVRHERGVCGAHLERAVDLYRSGVHPPYRCVCAAKGQSCSTARSVTPVATAPVTGRR